MTPAVSLSGVSKKYRVSRSMGMVTRFCTDAVLLNKGRVLTSGSPEEVADRYQEMVAKSQEKEGTGERDRQLDYEIEHEEEEDTPTFEIIEKGALVPVRGLVRLTRERRDLYGLEGRPTNLKP